MVQGVTRFPGVGCVVEFMQGNAPQIAWVLEEQNGRLRLLLPNRRETALQAARLLPWAGPAYEGVSSRDGAIEKMEKHRARRAELVQTIVPLDLWELSQGEVVRGTALWFAELLHAEPDADLVAACGHALLDFKSHFKFNPPDFEILPEEVVTARLQEQEAAQKREAFVREGTGFLRILWEARQKNQVVATPETVSSAVADRLRANILGRLSDPETQEDDALWRQLIKGLPDDPHLPLHLATAWGLVGPHHNFWMDRAGYAPSDCWSAEFTADVDELLAPVRRANGEDGQPAEQVELSPLSFVSIDSATTRDVDDAFHVRALPGEQGWELTLALACPAWKWPFGSAFDKAVLRRGTSLYLPEATHHMLPESLGVDGYSLLAHAARPALLVRCQIRPDGELALCEPGFAWVRLAANLQYEACERIFERGCTGDCEVEDDEAVTLACQFANQLRMGLALAEARQACRLRQGAVIIQRPDSLITLEGEGETIRVLLDVEAPAPHSHQLVAEHMMLANAALARWAHERGVALLHRTQDVVIPKDYVGIWDAPHDIARVVRALAPACLESTPRPHAGIGEAMYAPSTSPLRRYADLLNEAQILHYIEHGKALYSKEEIDAMLPVLNACLDSAGQVQRFRPRYWKLVYVRQEGDKKWWSGVITEENDAFVSVALPHEQLFVRGRRHMFGERTHPGQPVEIRLGKVSPLYNEMMIVETREI